MAIQILASDEKPEGLVEVDPGDTPDAIEDDDNLVDAPSPEAPVPAVSRMNI